MPETFTSAANGPDADAPFRSRLSFDLDVDICVVGAGLAGITVALEAARLGASVAVLEGRHVGLSASAWKTRASCGRCRRRAPITFAPPPPKRRCRESH